MLCLLDIVLHGQHICGQCFSRVHKSQSGLHATVHSSKTRPEGDPRHGYHTFCRGDLVKWIGAEHDAADIEEHIADAPTCGEDYLETVYAVMLFQQRSQQRRFLITFDSSLSKSSITAGSLGSGC